MTTRLKTMKKRPVKKVAKKTPLQRKVVIEKGARDFAVRFERVMKDLAKG